LGGEFVLLPEIAHLGVTIENLTLPQVGGLFSARVLIVFVFMYQLPFYGLQPSAVTRKIMDKRRFVSTFELAVQAWVWLRKREGKWRR